jgi:hypothetical protein
MVEQGAIFSNSEMRRALPDRRRALQSGILRSRGYPDFIRTTHCLYCRFERGVFGNSFPCQTASEAGANRRPGSFHA